jgi:hypothetical protein
MLKSSSFQLPLMIIEAIESFLNKANEDAATSTATEHSTNSDTATASEQPRSQSTTAKAYIECMLALSRCGNLTRDELESIATKLLLATSAPLPRTLDRFLFKRCLIKLIQSNKSNYTITIDEVLKALTQRFVQITTDGAVLNEVNTHVKYIINLSINS